MTQKNCHICEQLMLDGSCHQHPDVAALNAEPDRCPAVSPSGARCTGNEGHTGEHFDAERCSAWSEPPAAPDQSDAEIGAIVRAALNRYLADSVVTHAGVTKRLTLDHVVSADVSAVLGPGKVEIKIQFNPDWEVVG